MPGGLIQLSVVGAQNQLFVGNPTKSFFKKSYKKHTNFAMESVTLHYDWTPRQLPPSESTRLMCRVPRNTDLLLDCYVMLNLPNVWSPVVDDGEGGIEYAFQWVPHLGFNMIESVSVIINGLRVMRHTGEYMKLRAAKYAAQRRAVVETMVGHVAELNDPANAFGRVQQYPNAIRPSDGSNLEPSIRGRTLAVPLMFSFCEDSEQALHMIQLQNAVVQIEVVLRSTSDMYTIIDAWGTPDTNPTYGQRVRPDPTKPQHQLENFLSQPRQDGTASDPAARWLFHPTLEANYAFLDTDERTQLAQAVGNAQLVKEVRMQEFTGLYGTSLLTLDAFNMVPQMLWVAQRSDVVPRWNGHDNYTNWNDAKVAPLVLSDYVPEPGLTPYFSSGQAVANTDPRIVQTAQLLFNGIDRITEKPYEYFALVQHFRHVGAAPAGFPGVCEYSFGLQPDEYQPSGAVNASGLNKLQLNLNLQLPPLATDTTFANQVMLGARRPLLVGQPSIPVPACPGPGTSNSTLGLAAKVPHVSKGAGDIYAYTYTVRVYTESYNYLTYADGTAALSFAN